MTNPQKPFKNRFFSAKIYSFSGESKEDIYGEPLTSNVSFLFYLFENGLILILDQVKIDGTYNCDQKYIEGFYQNLGELKANYCHDRCVKVVETNHPVVSFAVEDLIYFHLNKLNEFQLWDLLFSI